MSKALFVIGGFRVEEHGDVFIIAEAGINHNGELKKALELVNIAAEVGAHAVKFQTFRAEDVATERAGLAQYQKDNIAKNTSQLEMIRKLELSLKDYAEIIARCKEKNILFLSTPHGGKNSVDFLERLGIPAYKIGSGDLTNYILLKRIGETHKPIILSTGMSTLKEVKGALSFLKTEGAESVAALHTTTSYPCPPQDVNLQAMVTMMNELDVPVGFSDHTDTDLASTIAATLGMAIYECHFTLDKNLPGPDHKASCTPIELKDRIASVKMIQIILGNEEKVPTISEQESMRMLIRKSLVYANDLKEGRILRKDDLAAKRPGDGVSPTKYEQFSGKKLTRDVQRDQPVQHGDVAS